MTINSPVLSVIFLMVISWANVCSSSKVLILLPVSIRSQKHAFDPIVEELVKRNHDITYVTMYKPSKETKGVTTILMGPKLVDYIEDASERMFNSSLSLSLGTIPKLADLFNGLCHSLMQDEHFQAFTKNPGSYDVIIVNSMVNECYLAVAAMIGAPIIIVSAPPLWPNLAWALDIPNPVSYLPMSMIPYNFTMNFFQRVVNFFSSAAMYALFTHVVAPLSENVVRKYIPDAQPIYKIINNASLILVNTHFSFEGPRPSMPYMIEVGCLHCNPGKKLPNDLEKFVDGSGDDGFIVFSLGTVVKGTFMNHNFVKSFKEAFSRIKQRVIWKYEKKLDGLSSNVMTVSWLPQQDLMAHPKCKLTITHGGLLSLQEVAYHGVPLLGVPLGADRVKNIQRASQLGFALSLDNWNNLTTEELFRVLNELIYNPRYRENSLKLSRLMKDRPEHPVQTAVFWVEYVIRHKGAPHLKSGAHHLNIFQYFLVDVFAFIILISGVSLFVVFAVAKRMCCYLFSLFVKSKPLKVKKS